MSSAILTSPVAVTSAQFKKEVLDSELPVLVDFWAAWCGPCRMIAPVLVEMAKEHSGKLKIAKVDVDANPDIAQQYGIMSIPTLMLFKKGKVEETFVGYMPKQQLEARVLPRL